MTTPGASVRNSSVTPSPMVWGGSEARGREARGREARGPGPGWRGRPGWRGCGGRRALLGFRGFTWGRAPTRPPRPRRPPRPPARPPRWSHLEERVKRAPAAGAQHLGLGLVVDEVPRRLRVVQALLHELAVAAEHKIAGAFGGGGRGAGRQGRGQDPGAGAQGLGVRAQSSGAKSQGPGCKAEDAGASPVAQRRRRRPRRSERAPATPASLLEAARGPGVPCGGGVNPKTPWHPGRLTGGWAHP
jgi:hypothetical protein